MFRERRQEIVRSLGDHDTALGIERELEGFEVRVVGVGSVNVWSDLDMVGG